MKKIINSLLAAALCLGTALPAFAGKTNVGGSTQLPVGTGTTTIVFTTPSGNTIYSVTLTAEQAQQLADALPSLSSGITFGPDVAQAVSLLFLQEFDPATGSTVTAQINNLGKAIAAFNKALTPAFLANLTPEQVAQLTELSNLLKQLRGKVDA